MTMLSLFGCCFRNGTAGTSERCKAETRAGSCSSLEHTDAHQKDQAAFGLHTSLHLMLLDSHILPEGLLLDARLVRRGVQVPA